jgi:hypothetical protein
VTSRERSAGKRVLALIALPIALLAACRGVASPPMAATPVLDASQPAAAAGARAMLAMDAGARLPNPAASAGAGGAATAGHAGAAQPPLRDAGAMQDEDAGPYIPPKPRCSDGVWQLAQGFLPAMPVDYIADRSFDAVGMVMVLSELGKACSGATNQAGCQASLSLPVQVGRHLVSTQGDSVRVWAFNAVPQLLGVVDTPAEALWYLLARGYTVPCGAKVAAHADRYEVRGVISPFINNGCGPVGAADAGAQPTATITVRRDGFVIDPNLDGPKVGCVVP